MQGIRVPSASTGIGNRINHLRLAATLLVLCALLAIGLALRTVKLADGLPRLYNPDEGLSVLPALHVAQSGNLDPGRFDYGSLAIYSLAVANRLGALLGVLPDLRTLPDFDLTARNAIYPQPVLFVFDRLVMAGLSLGAIVAVFGATRRRAGDTAALLAAAWMAISPLSVVSERWAVTDGLVQALVAVAFWAALWVYERPTWTRAVVAGGLVGLAASAKYPGALMIVPALLAVFLSRERCARWLPSLGVLVGAIGGFLLTTPYAILNVSTFLPTVMSQFQSHGVQARDYVAAASPVYYAQELFRLGEAALTVLALVGLVLIARRWPREAVILAAFPVAWYALICNGSPRAPRYLAPILPFMTVCAGYGLYIVASRLSRRRGWAGVALILAAFALPVLSLTRTVYTLYQPDSRDQTAAWVRQNALNVPIATDPYGLPPDAAHGPYVVYGSITDVPTQWYVENGYWIFLSDLRRRDPNRTRQQQARLDALDADPNLEVVTHIDGQIGGLPDTGVTILRPKHP